VHKPQSQVQQFHFKILEGPISPAEPKIRNAELRAKLILEEAFETAVALLGRKRASAVIDEFSDNLACEAEEKGDTAPDLEEAIDGVVDTLYVCYGTAEDIGVDLEPFFDEVHAANMRKRDPGRKQAASKNPLGKGIKPEGWVGPDIKGVLARVKLDYYLTEVKRLQEKGELPTQPTREQRINWVFGNCKLSNPDVTMEMVERAVDAMEK